MVQVRLLPEDCMRDGAERCNPKTETEAVNEECWKLKIAASIFMLSSNLFREMTVSDLSRCLSSPPITSAMCKLD